MLDHPVWVADDHAINQTAAAVVDGNRDTCSNMPQPAKFWVIDLGFSVAVDEVTIFASIVVGSITLSIA